MRYGISPYTHSYILHNFAQFVKRKTRICAKIGLIFVPTAAKKGENIRRRDLSASHTLPSSAAHSAEYARHIASASRCHAPPAMVPSRSADTV